MNDVKKCYSGYIEKATGSRVVKRWDNTDLPLALHIRNHSPCGFAWGYNGSGPAQLALALAWDYFRARWGPIKESADAAIDVYQRLKESVVAHWQQDGAWILPVATLKEWIRTNYAWHDAPSPAAGSDGGTLIV